MSETPDPITARNNLRAVLVALNEETGSNGGGLASVRVRDYIDNPLGASAELIGFVSALELRRWYIDPDKPNVGERASLWMNITGKLGNSGAADPGGWDGDTIVAQLQQIAEEA